MNGKRTSFLVKLRCQFKTMPRKGSPLMSLLNAISLESNKKIKINFNGGNLSSDGGLLLIKEFAAKVGLIKLVKKLFKTNDHTNSRIHTDSDNLMQMLYQIIAAYFEDDCADELTNDPVLTSILEKEALASQPTLSRFGIEWTTTLLHSLIL